MRTYIENSDGTYTYVTSQDEMVDEIAFDFYKTQIGSAEHIYENNQDLSQLDITLPIGTVIRLPAMPASTPKSKQIKLWD